MKDIFSAEEMKSVKKLSANYLQTICLETNKSGKLEEKPLPVEAQFSPVFTINILDFDKDGKADLLLCGNINHARLRFGKSDANYGILLKGAGNGQFSYINQKSSGFQISGDVRAVLEINGGLLFGINQSEMKAYKLQSHEQVKE